MSDMENKYVCSICNSMYQEIDKANDCCRDILQFNNSKIEELLNRKPKSWGNVSIKTFEQDIKLLTSYIKSQQELIKRLINTKE